MNSQQQHTENRLNSLTNQIRILQEVVADAQRDLRRMKERLTLLENNDAQE